MGAIREIKQKYFGEGDLEAFFGLFGDVFSKIAAIIGVLYFAEGFPADIVMGKILPGIGVGSIAGSLIYFWEAYDLGKKEGRTDVTALPFGVSSTQVFAWIYLIIVPIYRQTGNALHAWQVAVAACFLGGLVEIAGGFVSKLLMKWIDEDVPFERGTLAEPLSCVTHSMNMSGIQTGDYALISGAGAMGIIHVLLAKLRGAKVIVSEPTKERRDRALEFGADYVVDPIQEDLEARVREITNGRGVERAFFTAGGKVAIESSIQALAIRGTLVIYGGTGPNDQFMVDPKWFHYNEITITGVTKHTKETIRVATELLSMKNLPLDKLITSEFPFEKIEDALIEARNISSYRPVVLIGEK